MKKEYSKPFPFRRTTFTVFKDVLGSSGYCFRHEGPILSLPKHINVRSTYGCPGPPFSTYSSHCSPFPPHSLQRTYPYRPRTTYLQQIGRIKMKTVLALCLRWSLSRRASFRLTISVGKEGGSYRLYGLWCGRGHAESLFCYFQSSALHSISTNRLLPKHALYLFSQSPTRSQGCSLIGFLSARVSLRHDPSAYGCKVRVKLDVEGNCLQGRPR